MGLDIYVRWGEIEEDEDGYKEYLWYKEDHPEHERYKDQITGMLSAPYAGYWRESWPSLRWLDGMAKKYEAPHPLAFYAEWNGMNDDQLELDENNLKRVLAFRDEIVRPWLRNRDERNRVYEAMKDEARNGVDIDKMSDEEAEALMQRMSALHEHFDVFRQRMADCVSFINFIELHKDEPNLVILFH